MKKYIWLCLSFIATPILAQQSHTPPQGWNVLLSAYGDLNNDQKSDAAYIWEKQEGNIKKRVLAVFINPSLKPALVTKPELLSFEVQEFCGRDDSLGEKSLRIDRGYLWLEQGFWASCGTWWTSSTTYQIRYKNQQFNIIGQESQSGHRASDEITNTSTNYLTGELKKIIGDLETNTIKTTEWYELDPKPTSKDTDLSKITEFP